MKKVLLLLLCINLSVFVATAQSNILFGLKGGIGIPNLTTGSGNSNPLADGWSSRLGPYFGLVGQYDLYKRWSLQVELNYASQGGKKDGVQAIPSSEFASMIPTGYPVPAYLYANFNTVSRLNYIELPVMAKYTLPLNKKFDVFISAGPYVGFLFNAKNISTGKSNVYLDEKATEQITTQAVSFDTTQDIKSDLKQFNVGIQGGVGISMKLKKGILFFTAGGNYGFIPIQKDKSNGQNNTGAATLIVGYLVHLK